MKKHQNSSKSTFLEPFGLFMTGNYFDFVFSYEICIDDCLFNFFICQPGPCDQFLGPFRGSCCEKTPKIAQNHFSWTVWPNYDWKPFLLLFSYNIRIVDCLFNVFICHPGPCDQKMIQIHISCTFWYFCLLMKHCLNRVFSERPQHCWLVFIKITY